MSHIFPRFLSIVFATMLCACATIPSQEKKAPAEPMPVEKPMAQTPKAASEVLSNTLKWSTASEVENFGFDIYRSTSEDGPFEKMTQEPIPGAGTIDEPQSYVWKDTSIKADVAYFYYIESISYAGVRERFSPIIKAPAKHQP